VSAADDDLPLRSTSTESDALHDDQSPAPSPVRWLVFVLAGVVLGAGLTFWWMSRDRPGTATPAPTTATEASVGSHRPKRQPLPLPALDASDGFLRDLVAALSNHPMLARLLATPGLVREGTLAVVQIGEGRTPIVPLTSMRPATRAAATSSSGSGIAAGSYERWGGSIAALTSVSASDAAQVYVNVKPLFDQAYTELGNPNGDFDVAIVQAIHTLDETPSTADTATVTSRPGYIEYDDPALKALRPVQKQYLLLGPANRAKVRSWLHEFAAALELKID
jgi:hypothetical protein